MDRVEWGTLALTLGCYVIWAVATTFLVGVSPILAVLVTGVMVALHSSITHEVIHDHPTPWKKVNEALVFLPLMLVIPFQRFRDTHLAHHHDARLTDPFDDPETNFMYPECYAETPRIVRAILCFNNSLLGRLIVGPAVSQAWFMATDWAKIKKGDRAVLMGWVWHIPGMILVLMWVGFADMALWQYLMAAYLGNSLIKIRTFAEHQAHDLARARSVIIDDRGPLAFLFLNNNLHAVHHKHPKVPWYRLPRLYRQNKDEFLRRNDGYSFPSYKALFANHFFTRKDPVPHPLWHRD